MVEDSAKKNRADSKKGIPNGNKSSRETRAGDTEEGKEESEGEGKG
jgi:hypothetical protein